MQCQWQWYRESTTQKTWGDLSQSDLSLGRAVLTPAELKGGLYWNTAAKPVREENQNISQYLYHRGTVKL